MFRFFLNNSLFIKFTVGYINYYMSKKEIE